MDKSVVSSNAEEQVVLQCDFGSVDTDELSRLITSDWLTQALAQRHPGVVVEKVRIVRVVAGCSAKIWVAMDFNDHGRVAGLPPVMVVKSGFNRHDPIMLFTYDVEMRAYRDMLPRYPLNSPRCFYAGLSPDGKSAAVIIEDLNARGVRFCHALKPLTYDECAAFLEALAAFHARSWLDPNLLESDWANSIHYPNIRVRPAAGAARVDRANDNRLTNREIPPFWDTLVTPESWRMFTALPRGAAVPRRLHDRERFLEAYARLEEFGETQQQVAMMGDEHLGNLYIEPDGKPGFVDFQGRLGPWNRAIAYFMGCALDILDRRAWERDLIKFYLDRLAANGVQPPAFEEAFDGYCRQMLFGFFIWLTNGSQFQTEAVNTANTSRFAAALLDHDCFGRLGL